MQFIFKKIAFNILLIAIFSFLFTGIANASTTDNVYGWAWSENFGWVSFNCTNYFTCGTVNYGVNVSKTTGAFSGYAWSSNLGWISFEESDTPPDNYSFNTNCNETCNASNSCTACYKYQNDKIYGWAKILSLGDEGWMRFDHGGGGNSNNDVVVSDTTGDFSGYAWNGNTTDANAATVETGMGWLSFNCSNNNICGSVRYLVNGDFVNNAPTVANMSAPNWSNSTSEACGTQGARQAILKWDFDDYDAGACELAYQIIVDDDPVRDDDTPLLDTGKCEGTYSSGQCFGGADALKCQSSVTANSYNLRNALESDGKNLTYGTAYYWWIKVWDERSEESAWYQYATVPDTNNDDGNSNTFTTYAHPFPGVGFTLFPANPALGEPVDFTDTSLIYRATSGTTSSGSACAGNCSWAWTFEQAEQTATTTQNPRGIRFLQGGAMNVSLTVTDNNDTPGDTNDDYACTNSINVENVSVCLPLWQERKP